MVLSPHGNAPYFLDSNRPLWYILPRYSATTVMYGILYCILYFFWVTLACVWYCDASKFTEHENHQTSNLNTGMKYSREHNKRHVQITGRHSQPTGNDNKKRYAPRCQLLHHQIKAVKEPPSPLQTTVSYGIILSHGHKSTATSAKRQFDTSNYVHHKI